MQRTTLMFLICVGLAVGASSAAADSALARSCNAVVWKVPPDSSDDMPAALRKIQQKLIKQQRGAVPSVIDGLPHSLNLRRIASAVLARRPGDKTRAALLTLLRDPDAYVAREAAFALGLVGGAEVIPSLRSMARKGPDAVRHNAINALSQLGAADASVVVLLAAVGDASEGVACSALDALSGLRGSANQDRAIQRIERLLEAEPAPTVAKHAQTALRVLQARRG